MVNFSEYILWTQSSSMYGDDILLVDGKQVSSLEEEEYFSYISLISNDTESKWDAIFENTRDYPGNDKKSLSRSFSIYQNNEGCILVKSIFLDKDETGRKIAYLFCCRSMNLQDVNILLKNAASSIDRNLNAADLLMIDTLRYKKYIPFIGILILFTILIIVLALWIILK